MDSYISYSGWRNERWKGHSNERDVRAAIRYARERGRSLRLFALDFGAPDQALYVELSPASWDATFFVGA